MAAWLLTPALVAAQSGRIAGRIVDGTSARPIAGAHVSTEHETAATFSSIDGGFLLRSVPSGTHSVIVRMVGYGTKTVTGVVVANDSVTQLEVALYVAAVQMAGLVVEATIETGSTTALLSERRRESYVVDAIGADQISKSPDGDAAAVLKRVPGLSVVGGKFAYVRGLGERYSGTTLNGSPLASPMPDRKAVPLDIVPADLLESIVTAKTYSPDQPGDYAGGLVELRTRNFPSRRLFSLAASGTMKSGTTFQEGLRYTGGGLDFLGLDDGTRGLPSDLPTDRRVIYPNFTRAQLETFGEAFVGDWGPVAGSLPPDASLGLSYGDNIGIFGRPFGLLASLNYSNSYIRKDNIVERIFASAGADDPEVDYAGDAATRSVSLGGLANLAYELSSTDRITGNVVYSRLMDDEARTYQGFNLDTNADQRNHRLRFLVQTLANTQLKGEHLLQPLANARLEWRGAWSRARRFEPNTREVLYRKEDGRFRFYNFVQSGSVFHQNLVDDTYSGAIHVDWPFGMGRGERQGRVRLGGSMSAKARDVYTRRFRFLAVPGGVIDNEVRERDPNHLFDDETIGSDGFELQEATYRPDNYDATEDVVGAFAMVETELAESLGVLVGLRVESASQSVSPRDLFESVLPPLEPANLEDVDVLPSVNATLAVGERSNLRVGASQTLARPQLRELAPFAYADYAGGYLTVGNPELHRSLIRNFDLRWETFLGGNALVAASAFYKMFFDPIEVAVLPSTELLKTWVNGGTANNWGFELEMRSDLDRLAPALSAFALNANVTLVQSKVNVPDVVRVYIPGEGGIDLSVVARERALQGQSPYIVNVGLVYASEGRGGGATTLSVLFNRFGKRIYAVGGQATPDIFEEANSQLDVVVERRINGHTKVRLSASRLLGSTARFTQYDGLLRQWDTGRTLSLSVGWDTGG